MWHHLLAAAALLATSASGFILARVPPWPAEFEQSEAAPACIGRSVFELSTMRLAAPNYAHVATAVRLRDGRIRAFWYEGSAESVPDVKIYSALYDGSRWTAPAAVIGPAETAASTGTYVRKVGNAMAYRNADDELVLIYATIGFGGWSGAALNIMTSGDEGATWSPPRRLLTSATFNFSTLVRAPAVPLTGGFTLIPAYQEFLAKIPEVLLLDRDGRLHDRRRIGAETWAIQPFIVVFDARRARAFSRTREGDKMPVAETEDAGASWDKHWRASMTNIDTPTALQRLQNGQLLAVYTTEPQPPRKYGGMGFSVSDDEGLTWKEIYTIRSDGNVLGPAYYPWLVNGADGLFHLLFTHSLGRGSRLVHVRFSRDWIAEQGGAPCP